MTAEETRDILIKMINDEYEKDSDAFLKSAENIIRKIKEKDVMMEMYLNQMRGNVNG